MKHPPMRFTKAKLGEGPADSDGGGGGRSPRIAAAAVAAAAAGDERLWVARRPRPVTVLIPFQSQSSTRAVGAGTMNGVGRGACLPFPGQQQRGPLAETPGGGAGRSHGAHRPHSSMGREAHAIITELISAAAPNTPVNLARGQTQQQPSNRALPIGIGSGRPGSSSFVATGGAERGGRGGPTVETSPRRWLMAGDGAACGSGGVGARTKLPMPTVSLSLGKNSAPPGLDPSPRHRGVVAGESYWDQRPLPSSPSPPGVAVVAASRVAGRMSGHPGDDGGDVRPVVMNFTTGGRSPSPPTAPRRRTPWEEGRGTRAILEGEQQQQQRRVVPTGL